MSTIAGADETISIALAMAVARTDSEAEAVALAEVAVAVTEAEAVTAEIDSLASSTFKSGLKSSRGAGAAFTIIFEYNEYSLHQEHEYLAAHRRRGRA